MKRPDNNAESKSNRSSGAVSKAQLEELKRRLEHNEPAGKPDGHSRNGGGEHKKHFKKKLPPFTPPAGTMPNANGKPVPRPGGKNGHYTTWKEDNCQDLYYVWIRYVNQKPGNTKEYCFYLDRKFVLANKIPEPGDTVKCMTNRERGHSYKEATRSDRATVLRVEKAGMDYDDFIFLLHGGHMKAPRQPVVAVFKKRRNTGLSY